MKTAKSLSFLKRKQTRGPSFIVQTLKTLKIKGSLLPKTKTEGLVTKSNTHPTLLRTCMGIWCNECMGLGSSGY